MVISRFELLNLERLAGTGLALPEDRRPVGGGRSLTARTVKRAPARDTRGGSWGSWGNRVARLGAAALPGLWLLILGWVIAIYFITHYMLPRLPLSASGSVYIVQPALWFSLGLAGLLFWHRGLREKPPLLSYIGVVALLAGVFHIALLILTGVMAGFGHSPYGDSPAVIAKNALYVGSGVLGLELTRASLVAVFSRRSSLLALAFVSLMLALITIPPARFTDLSGGDSGFPTAGDTFLPALAESLLASFLALVGGPLAAIAYRGALEAFRWFSPILPDLSWGATAFVGTLAPAMALLIIRGLTVSAPAAARPEDRRSSWSLVPLGVALVAVGLIWLSTGLLGVRPALVAGQSMEPALTAGDLVLTRDVSPDDIAVGDIIRFNNRGTTILHRVVEIYDSGSARWFVTKGDANNTNDTPITADQVEGKVIATIPKIGRVGIFVKNTFGRFLGPTLPTIVVGDTVWGASGSPAPFTAVLTASGRVQTGSWPASVETDPETLDVKHTENEELPQGASPQTPAAAATEPPPPSPEAAQAPPSTPPPLTEAPSAPPASPTPPPPAVATVEYTVRPGERLSEVAAFFGTTVDAIVALNGLTDPNLVVAGQRLVVPAPPANTAPGRVFMSEYVVRPGETLTDIAARFGTTVEALAAENGLANPSAIRIGDRLLVP